MKGMEDLLAQAGKMQQEFVKFQQELESQTVEGQSGAGLVKVVMNGKHQVQRVTLDPSLLAEDRAMLEDMIAAACNDATRLIASKMQDGTRDFASRMQLPPGFKLPF